MSTGKIADLQPGQAVRGRFLVARKELREARTGKKFLDLTLMDQSGRRVIARLWQEAESAAGAFEQGSVIAVEGAAETFRNELQLRLHQIRVVPPEEADPSAFLPRSAKDIDALEHRIAEAVRSVSNSHLSELLLSFFRDEGFSERFRTAPGAKALHHAYIGGLCEHTAEVVELCTKVADMFPKLDRDLLLTGAILHDVGKTEEQIEGFPEELKLRLSHMILSHHGAAEFGSPKLPMTAEAIALHHAEDLDAKVNMFLGQIAAAREQGRPWTDRHFLLKRSLYVGEAGKAGPPPEGAGNAH